MIDHDLVPETARQAGVPARGNLSGVTYDARPANDLDDFDVRGALRQLISSVVGLMTFTNRGRSTGATGFGGSGALPGAFLATGASAKMLPGGRARSARAAHSVAQSPPTARANASFC